LQHHNPNKSLPPSPKKAAGFFLTTSLQGFHFILQQHKSLLNTQKSVTSATLADYQYVDG
jgi:hypothetical protein